MRGLQERRLPMFSSEDLKCLDSKYFNVITTDAYDVTIMTATRGITGICIIQSTRIRER